MPRRSYLSRLAQPLTAGDPVIASIPRAAAEESRHAVSALPPSAHAPRFPNTARSPAVPERVIQARPVLSPPADRPFASAKKPSPEQTQPSKAAHVGCAAHEVSTPVTDGRRVVARQALPQQTRLASAGQGSLVSPRPLAIRASEATLADAPGEPRGGQVSPPSPPASLPSRAKIEEPVASAAAPQHATDAAPPPRGLSAAREAPRLHIGAIEVRVTQPAPPSPPALPPIATPTGIASSAAPAAASSIARPYASRFGLAQG
jgi:hypothetical protein